ncbi:MAG: hypothetical protein V1913_11620 [Fibrobacterota bacterium]
MAKKAAIGEKKAKTSVHLDDFFDQVTVRALEIYLERQGTGKAGDDVSDWAAAEKDIKAKYNID